MASWLFIILTTVISRRTNQCYIHVVSQLLLEQNIWLAWSLVFLPTILLVLLKIHILHQSINCKNHFENSNFWGMWHLGHVTHIFINMLFISTGIVDDISRHYRKFPFKSKLFHGLCADYMKRNIFFRKGWLQSF